MNLLTVWIASVTSTPRNVLAAPILSSVLEEPSTSHMRNVSGIMIVSTVKIAPYLWWAVVSSQIEMTSFALSVVKTCETK